MVPLTWILSLICVAGGHLFSASPVLRSALVVQAGQNVSLACNLTSRQEITWYLLRSDQLLPVLTVRSSRVGEDTVNVHIADRRRVNSVGDLKSGSVGLEIEEVQEDDAGLYFCTGRCAGAVCVNRGIHLVLDGVDVTSARQPCWTLGIAVLVALLVLCVVASVGVCVCSGKPDVCCCTTASSSTSLKVTEPAARRQAPPPKRRRIGRRESDVLVSGHSHEPKQIT